MGGFRSIGYPVFIFSLFALPALLVGAGGLITLALIRLAPVMRRKGFQVALMFIGFVLLDVVLLKGLAWLGVSYGPVTFVFVVLTGLRITLFVLWAVIFIRLVQSEQHFIAPYPFLLANMALTGLIVYGFYIEPMNPQVTRVVVPVSQSRIRQPFRIVQLSDTHIERTTARERAVLSMVRDLHPDLIVLTGDYLNLSYLQDPAAQRDAQAFFAQLFAPYGIFAVKGSVDNPTTMDKIFAGTGVKGLYDQVEQINWSGGALSLIGVLNYDTPHDPQALHRLAEKVPADAFHLLLFHTPDLALDAAQSDIDLYLAGHTHGGQICLPVYGAIVTDSVFGKRYEAGRYPIKKTTLYVSRGLGMEGGLAPRARFLAPPEIVVFDLVPQLR